MIYCVATEENYAQIDECLQSTGYYDDSMPASEMDGLRMIAKDESGKVHAVLWAMVCGRHAYLDYFCLHSHAHSIVAAKLGIFANQLLKELGIKYVRAMIKSDNVPARRLAAAAGMGQHHDYVFVERKTPDGRKEARD